MKKRNKDYHFRVSHSDGRPFESGNELGPKDWHAFVFPDMKPRFVPNALIARAIANGQFTAGHDTYDTWADVGDAVTAYTPPRCSWNGSYPP